MNGKKAKEIRRIAREEMNAGRAAAERDLVITGIVGKDGYSTGVKLINEPLSERAMSRAMKKVLRKKSM